MVLLGLRRYGCRRLDNFQADLKARLLRVEGQTIDRQYQDITRLPWFLAVIASHVELHGTRQSDSSLDSDKREEKPDIVQLSKTYLGLE